MGLDVHLYIEKHEDGRWVNPVELRPMLGTPSVGDQVTVCWFAVKGPQKDLLFGPHKVVPMQPGLPEDRCPELQQWVSSSREPWKYYEGWCSLEDMWLDSWETETVLVSTQVERELVEHFGNGELTLTEMTQALARTGMPDHSIRWLRYFDARLCATPEDWSNYRRYQLDRWPSDRLVPVTWRETYAECGDSILWDDGLACLRALENKHLYRIVTCA